LGPQKSRQNGQLAFNLGEGQQVNLGARAPLPQCRSAPDFNRTRYCYRKSSVRPSVTLIYDGRIGWTSSKVIARIISVVSSLLGLSHNISNLVQREHP